MILDISSASLSEYAAVSNSAIGQDTISVDNTKVCDSPPRVQPADWMADRGIIDRRERHRSRAAFTVSITPLNIALEPTGQTQAATLLNYSEDGACLEHAAVLIEPYVRMHWNDSQDRGHTAVIRLKWCRSIGENVFLSGGKVVGMD